MGDSFTPMFLSGSSYKPSDSYFRQLLEYHYEPTVTDYVPFERQSIPKKYIINRKATVLIWEDGSKTIIRKSEDDRHDPIKAFLWAFFEKKSGLTRTKANQYLRKIEEEGFRDDKGKKFKRKWNTRGTKRVHRRNNQRNNGR